MKDYRLIKLPEKIAAELQKSKDKFPPEICTMQARVSWAIRQWLKHPPEQPE